jgi:cell division protein ZapE
VGRSIPAGAGGVGAALDRLVRTGALQPDARQAEAARLLDEIAGGLTARSGVLSALRRRRKPVKGLYLHGSVGRGKTLLMDLFFEAVPIAGKRRVHFHEFMDEVHAAIADFRRAERARGEKSDPVVAVAKATLSDLRLICLDEFQVSDITNAMLLGRLFEQLLAAGTSLVATSNVAPERLYWNGLNRQLFTPFIDLLERNVTVFALDGPTDYRRLKFEGQAVFHFGTGQAAKAAMDRLWARVTGGVAGVPASLTSLGRTIEVPEAAMGVARFPFAALCEAPLGARDYLRLAHAYDAVIIDGVPQFDRTRSNAAKRFILLIDTLYDSGVKLGASFAAPIEQLSHDEDTRFEFERTVSRLIEMQSADYLNAPRKSEAA